MLVVNGLYLTCPYRLKSDFLSVDAVDIWPFNNLNYIRKEIMREYYDLNLDWKFHLGEMDQAASSEQDDRAWEPVDLPHDFQLTLPWDSVASGARGFKPMCSGWYRRKLIAYPEWRGKRVLLDFEGMMLVGDCWFNGVPVGKTDYGYLGFESDITSLLNYDVPNIILVHCSSQKEENSRWYTGCGLNREVHLLVKGPISIARHGVFVTTPQVDAGHAEIRILVNVEGMKICQQFGNVINMDSIRYQQGGNQEVEIIGALFSPDGELVAESRTFVRKDFKRTVTENILPTVYLTDPRLWSCETPELYSVRVRLLINGETADEVTRKFGIRKIEFSPEYGFRLNGKKVFLTGSADHHDLIGPLGAASSKKSFFRMLDTLKSFGMNHIRCAHNPYPEDFLEAADEKGFLVVDELYDGWAQQWAGGRETWMKVWPENLKEWVLRDRNHPSVIAWSLGNEIQMREDRCEFLGEDWCVTGYKVLNTLLKRYDSTRPSTIACFPARAGAVTRFEPEFATDIRPPELAVTTEISSFNYLPEDYEAYLRHAPHMTVYQSEALVRELSRPFFAMNREKMVGLAYWGAIEYWGESLGWPFKGMHFSFFNHSLEPLPQAWLLKSIFTSDPVVHIGVADESDTPLSAEELVRNWKPVSSHWNREPGKFYSVFVYTNGEEVELLRNGESLGVRMNNGHFPNVICWEQVSYALGTLTAIARSGGIEIARDELETAGPAVKLLLEPEHPEEWKAGGMDLLYVKIRTVDSLGRQVPLSDHVRFTISGAGKLIAVDNGDHASDELFDRSERSLYRGFALAVLRSGRTSGTVNFSARTPSGLAAELELKIC